MSRPRPGHALPPQAPPLPSPARNLERGGRLWLQGLQGGPAAESGSCTRPRRGPARRKTGGGIDLLRAAQGTTCCSQTACCWCCQARGPLAPARRGAPPAELSGCGPRGPVRLRPNPGPRPRPRRCRSPTRAGVTAFPWKSCCKFSGCWWRLMGLYHFSAGTLPFARSAVAQADRIGTQRGPERPHTCPRQQSLRVYLEHPGPHFELTAPLAARVCRRWNEAASQPALWHTLTLSPPLAGRPAKSGAKAEKKLLSSLEWLMPNRFSQLQRLTLIHWKSQLHSVLKLVSESCPRLSFLKLSDCHGVTPDALIMLAKACPQLHSLDIQHSMVESTAVVSFLEEAGPRMQKLWLTYNSQTTAILGALLGSCCPQLQVLEVSTGLNHNITPLQLPVEALQKGCPQLQVLRLLNLMWLPKPSGRAMTPGPGFPSLEELCLASSTCNFVSNEVLGRLLHGSPHLRLLDLRGCARITPAGLHDLPCQELEQLHLGLYGMSDRLTLAKEGSPLLTQKWCHSLRELDLSGQGFSEKDLEQALAAFSGTPGGSHLALCSLNLRGTRVTPGTVSSVISSCPGLRYLNLESCRCLPRGLKRAYRGPEEVQWCLEQLLTSLPSPS
ncbi:F-box/LRR-repeat protein 6 isoform X1 [Bos mutus]|uniref:F-box/LRR-repeat protein 6 isoform X1 n=1 Tax=Bos mutus TaxID=72004 RepID=UPI0038B5659A